MKFTFDKETMIKEISIAQEIVSKNATSILSNVLLTAANNTLVIKATDIKVNYETKIPIQVEEEGSATIYCDKFMAILNNLDPGEIEFNNSVENGDSSVIYIKAVTKKVCYKMKSMSEDKYPEFDSNDSVPYFEVKSKDIKDMIAQTIFAVSDDETRYFLNGVYFEKKENKLNLVATDGRRLSIASKSILEGVDDFPAAIVPPKILGIILKHAPEEGNIMIAIVEKMIFFKFGNYKFGSVLIEGKFPDYSRVIPENQAHSFFIEKKDLVDTIKKVSIMVDKTSGRLYFEISSGNLRILSQPSAMGSADVEIPCEYDGENYKIAMNCRHIEEPLKVIDSERIKFEFTEEMKAVTMESEPASDYLHIIMPMSKE